MVTENLATLKIHKLTQEQYDRELAAGSIEENAIYLTPAGSDGIVLTEGVDYGTELPTEAPKGKIFFLKV